MSEVSIIGKAQAKVVPLAPLTNRLALKEFFSHHGEETTEVLLKFFEDVFAVYKTTNCWQYLTIKEKAAQEVNYTILLKLIQNLKR